MWQFFLCSLLAAASLTQPASIGSECTTVEGEVGTCINFSMCKSLTEPLKSIPLPLPKSVTEYLRSSHCGFNQNIPKVCCPKLEGTPDWNYVYHSNAYLLTRNSCGFSKELRKIGGIEAELGEFPWMALLVYGSNTEPYQCSGSVITERYILTAAHCIKSILKKVRLGEHRFSTAVDCEHGDCNAPVQEFGIEKTIIHSLYTPSTISADIALIRLDRSIDFSQGNVKPVCLPVHNKLNSLNLNSKNLTVIGWGNAKNNKQSDVLLKVQAEVVSNEKCNELYRSQTTNSLLDDNKMCAGKTGQDFCRGDGGGPLMHFGKYDYYQRYVQYGIVSYGPLLCDVDLPVIFTRISKYMKWILDNLRP